MAVKQLAGNMDKAPGFKMWQRERGDLFLSTSKYAYNLSPIDGIGWCGGVTGLGLPITFQSSTLNQSGGGRHWCHLLDLESDQRGQHQ